MVWCSPGLFWLAQHITELLMAWGSTAWYSPVWHGMVQHGIAWRDTAWPGSAWHSPVQPSPAQSVVAQQSPARLSLARHGLVCTRTPAGRRGDTQGGQTGSQEVPGDPLCPQPSRAHAVPAQGHSRHRRPPAPRKGHTRGRFLQEQGHSVHGPRCHPAPPARVTRPVTRLWCPAATALSRLTGALFSRRRE